MITIKTIDEMAILNPIRFRRYSLLESRFLSNQKRLKCLSLVRLKYMILEMPNRTSPKAAMLVPKRCIRCTLTLIIPLWPTAIRDSAVPFRASPLLLTGVALSKTSHSALLGLPPNGQCYRQVWELADKTRKQKMPKVLNPLSAGFALTCPVHEVLG